MDQEMYESLSFSMRDDEDLLVALDESVKQDVAETEHTAELDRLAGIAEESARRRLSNAEHEVHEARTELKLAHEQRIAAKHVHAAAKTRLDCQVHIVKSLRIHTSRTRKGVVEWATFKGFAEQQLPEAQLMARGGLAAMVAAHRRRMHQDEQGAEMSASEAEAI
jgi:hypothetical protein